MNENHQNFIYASLRDQGMAKQITLELSSRGILGDIVVDDSGMAHLYVFEEKHIPEALDYFRVKIGHPKHFETPKEWENIKSIPLGKFTFSIFALCIVIFGFGFVMQNVGVYEILMFGPKSKHLTWSYIQQGEVWRLLTPAFIHFGFMHIIFNLLWWKDLGNILEYTKGKAFLALFLVATGVFSNSLQAVMTGTNFGGLSGVVYALLGYLWIYKLVNKKAKFSLPKTDIYLMIGWFFLCLFDVFQFQVANWAHGGGLALGMIFGALMGMKDKDSLAS